ncbi:MAG: SDR family NAD(P)-dependent oxidoreductase [Candidatus Berkiella sp.]
MASYLIIASTSDIGQSIAELLHSAGHRLLLTGRKNDAVAALANQLQTPFVTLDASSFEAVDHLVAKSLRELGSLDGIVNCAGSLLLKPAHLTSSQQYHDVIEASLTTSFAVVRAAGKHLIDKGGAVVLISSAAALTGFANHEAIAAAKAGIIGLARSAAASYAPYNLRFNVVAPGLVQTKLTEHLTSTLASKKASELMHPLRRLGKPSDVARAVQFLLEPQNSWITGQVLPVDGGLSNVKSKTVSQ